MVRAAVPSVGRFDRAAAPVFQIRYAELGETLERILA